MLKPEYTETVLQMLKEGKTEREIAVLTKKHRNTVTRYVKHLRQSYIVDFTLLQNEVISELQARISRMSDRDLVRFLACLLPVKIESKSEVDLNVNHTTEILAEYTTILRETIPETDGTLQPNNPTEPVHTTPTAPKAGTIPIS